MKSGLIALISSGETTPSGGLVYDALARDKSAPIRIAMLETPAGFEPNAHHVLNRVATYLAQRLQNLKPELSQIGALRRDGAGGADDPVHAPIIFGADLIYLGAGSPTYAARHLADTRLWQAVIARNRLGAGLAMASAAAVASGAFALPVYEIYKAGQDLHWTAGLDVFGAYGLRLAIIPHWNNNDGGEELDTGRCFMGQARFARLRAILPSDVTVLGLDERTGMALDPSTGDVRVLGLGGVTVLSDTREFRFEAGSSFNASAIGPFHPADPASVNAEVFAAAEAAAALASGAGTIELVPEVVNALLAARAGARATRDWKGADALRTEIAALGWRVEDTPAGQRLTRAD